MVVGPLITLATRKGMSSNVIGRDVSLIHEEFHFNHLHEITTIVRLKN
jgi:hypothetical protein